ncbi:MAG: hypothetical protein ACPLRO_06075, partial [Candidatus Kapaibacteriota bacterium]
ASKTSIVGIAMMYSFVYILWLCIFLFSCSNKTDEQKNISTTLDSVKKNLFTFSIDTNQNQVIVKPFPPEKLAKIFPTNIFEFKLDKINKGTINYSGNLINSASAEYVSRDGLIIVYIYDYTKFSNLPYYLRNLFELSTKDEILSISNGVAKFSYDNLSSSESLDCIISNRFHIKIEGVHYPNFRESALDILNNLNLGNLIISEGLKSNGKF